MEKLLSVIALTSIAAIWFTGCDCEAESDDELCGRRECGSATLVDRCGERRNVDCGGCEDLEECSDHQCRCEGESRQQLCDQMAADCGSTTVTDRCGRQRTVECGGCPEVGACVDNTCRCDDQSTETLCDDNGLECGAATVVDACGTSREIECGGCTSPEECSDNACVCQGESADELCADRTGACGAIEVTDSCGEVRQIECQPCADRNVTLGAVRDGESGELVDDALIRVYEWPPPEGTDFEWIWKNDYRADDPDFATTTGSANSAGDSDVNYEFSPGDSICREDATTALLEPGQWYRIRVDRPGYDPELFYRRHTGWDAGDCPADCPVSEESGCHRQDFEIWPDGSDRLLEPDLFVDVRDMNQHTWQCALLPESADHDRLIGLRIRLGGANLGPGPFHLEGAPGDESDEQGVVYQHISRSEGDKKTVVVDSETFDYYSDSQPRLLVWARLRLVDPVEECRDVDDRSEECVAYSGDKLSYCLHDYNQFDEDLMSRYGGLTSSFKDPPTCEGAEQGITPGWEDIYWQDLPDQVVVAGPPSEAADLGEQWVEMEIDPEDIVHERDRSNNVARIAVEPPSEIESVCEDPETVLDCRGPAEEYDRQQEWQCPDYLEY